MMNAHKTALFAVTTASLMGCAGVPPAQVQSAVDTYLRSTCKELFLATGYPNYQHFAQIVIASKAVFALAQDESGEQKCGIGRNGIDIRGASTAGVTWEQVEAVAVAKCEAAGSTVKTPCKVFARNNEIVWKQSARQEFQ